MALTKMVVEMGMGTDLQGGDYTKAAVRALRDALWHNSLSIGPAFGLPRDAIKVQVNIGVTKPQLVDCDQVRAVLPYGTSTVEVVEGGLDIVNDSGTKVTVIANAAAVVYLDLEAGG